MRYLGIVICVLTLSASAQDLAEADALLLNAEYERALDVLSARRQNPTDPSLHENKMAQVLIHMGRFTEAETILRSLSSNVSNRGITLTNLGLLNMYLGRHDDALDALQEALGIFELEERSSTLEAALAVNYLGLVFNATGNYEKAGEHLLQALLIREKLLPPDHELIAASNNDLGLAFANSDPEKALDHYEKALKIYRRLHGENHPKIAIGSINTGMVYRKIELYGDAVNNFETGLKIWEQIYQGPHPSKAFALMNLGETYAAMQNRSAAQGYYTRSLEMYRQSYGAKHPDIAQVLNSLGNLFLADNNFKRAIESFQEALIANVAGFEERNPEANPPVGFFYNGHVLLYTLLNKARAFEKQYFGKTLRFSDLTRSLETLTLCDSLIDNLRRQTTNESDKIALGATGTEVYADGVRISYEAAMNSIQRKRYLEMAFYFAEKSKSAVLLESISDANAKSFAGIPEHLMEQEKEIRTAIAVTTQKLSQKPDGPEERQLRAALYDLNRKFESFTVLLEKEFPKYFDLKFNSASPSIKEVQTLLDAQSAVISYFIDDANSRLYTFVIGKNNYDVYEKSLPSGFNKYVTGFRNGIYFNEASVFKLAAEKLSELLVPPLRSKISEIVILPTGRMNVIPFEALFSGKFAEDDDIGELPYLLRKYSVRYEFSASLMLQKIRSVRTPSAKPAILLCAPVNFPGMGLPSLPGTEAEVRNVESLFSKYSLASSVRISEQASEAHIKENEFEGFSYIHLATHGVVDEQNPELSRVYLHRGETSEDGNLYSGEIYNLEMNADLVTLSACQTGLGKISKGEGVIGLSRALVYAGARNVIVSYWSVADESTARLMTDFYEQLVGSGTPAFHKSLRQSKLNLMKDKNYAAPYFWAPFILIGF